MKRTALFSSVTGAAVLFLLALLAPLSIRAADVVFTHDLKLGDRGEDVRGLQKFLNGAGFLVARAGAGSAGNETTYFGGLTKRALSRWQATNGLPATGYFGPLSRAEYIKAVVLENAPNPRAGGPVVERVSPAEVKKGDTVTVFGSGFTPTGNSVLLWYGALQQKIENLPSPDGKTLTFVFSPPDVPALTREKINSFPADVRSGLEQSLRAQGKTLDDIANSYAGISSMADLESVLKKYGRSAADLKDLYRVIVRNALGESNAQTNVVLKGIRSFPWDR